MARKTTGNTTTNRSKKTAAFVQPAAEFLTEVPRNGNSASLASTTLEEEIRSRAYELYLQRRATAGSENVNGDENQDWLIAEREILSRHGGQERHSA
jgi:hypothetical protein